MPHVQWVPEKLRRLYREQPRVDSGEDEAKARDALRPKGNTKVKRIPSLREELAGVLREPEA